MGKFTYPIVDKKFNNGLMNGVFPRKGEYNMSITSILVAVVDFMATAVFTFWGCTFVKDKAAPYAVASGIWVACGGGCIRSFFLSLKTRTLIIPPFFSSVPLQIAALAGLTAFFALRRAKKLELILKSTWARALDLVDLAGCGLYSVTGTVTTLSCGVRSLVALIPVSFVSSTGGGLSALALYRKDKLSVFRSRLWYYAVILPVPVIGGLIAERIAANQNNASLMASFWSFFSGAVYFLLKSPPAVAFVRDSAHPGISRAFHLGLILTAAALFWSITNPFSGIHRHFIMSGAGADTVLIPTAA